MKIKRILCALAALSMLTALTACGESSSAAPASAPASQAESSAAPAAPEESSETEGNTASDGSDFTVTFSPLTENVYDVAACTPSAFKAGDTVIGEITWCYGPVATFSEGSYVMYNKMQFYAVDINDTYVLIGTPNQAGSSGSLNLLSTQVDSFINSYREDMTEEELEAIRPWTTAQIDGRVEPLPEALKTIFADWYGEGFEQDCISTVYLVDNAYKE
ncbi:MAG: hypothetical protein IJ060_00225 [Oscillospiraceae bacterium]|nr:hypothetical protein [Oscillospiraceae bacterium]